VRAIFTYHSIDSSGSPISLPEESFKEHVRFFGSGRVRVVPLSMLPSLPDEMDAVALTFDDGFLNFTSAVLPILAHVGFPATVFVVSDAVGTSNATRTHSDLTQLSPAQLNDETEGCVERILAELGDRPRRFAYPYGYVNDDVARIARTIFEHSVTTELRPVASDDDLALLPRIDAWYFRKSGHLEAWGSAAFRRRLWIRAQGRRVRAMVGPRRVTQ
jgi:peptidoglycan/xylan/chitin deacetylase (PgdA/CDA1 family)